MNAMLDTFWLETELESACSRMPTIFGLEVNHTVKVCIPVITTFDV